ncbi:hypothetical protein [Paraburkholderia youngii]|uniref:hypothetical protein n=1 Tax=Paraburkholderia youngii TaxID=2782701 RepID=UPI003D1F8BBB
MNASTPFQGRVGGEAGFSATQWRIAVAVAIFVMCVSAIVTSIAESSLRLAAGSAGVHLIASAAQYDKYCLLTKYGAPASDRQPMREMIGGLKVREFRKVGPNGDFQTMPYAGNPVPCDGWYPDYDRSADNAAIERSSKALGVAWMIFGAAALTGVFSLFRLSRKI